MLSLPQEGRLGEGGGGRGAGGASVASTRGGPPGHSHLSADSSLDSPAAADGEKPGLRDGTAQDAWNEIQSLRAQQNRGGPGAPAPQAPGGAGRSPEMLKFQMVRPLPRLCSTPTPVLRVCAPDLAGPSPLPRMFLSFRLRDQINRIPRKSNGSMASWRRSASSRKA